jgi:hypothetical protein
MPRIYLEAFLIKLCHFRKIVPLQDLVRDVASLRAESPRALPKPQPPSPPSAGTAGPGTAAKTPPPSPAAPKAAPAESKEVFARVLEKLAAGRAPLAAMLGQYSSVAVKGDLIDVAFASGKGFFVTSVREKDIKAVERAASEVLGRAMTVRFTEENSVSGEPIRPARELETALKDPAVQFFMNTFKASVLSADPIQAARAAPPKGRGPTENGQ